LLDFPHEVAMLSLWLAEHQMNVKFKENFWYFFWTSTKF
jgi:hypothetical protein